MNTKKTARKLKGKETVRCTGMVRRMRALERDNARQSLRAAEQEVEEIDTLCNDFRRANSRLVAERDAARGFNDILKGVNLRLTADLAAAMERLNHAESIIMQ